MDSSNADPWEGFTGQSQADADDALITDPLVRQISELRAALGDSEARRAELEAVIEKVRERLVTLQTNNIRGGWASRAAESILRDCLSTTRSVVLEDRDREVAARAVEAAARDLAEPAVLWWSNFYGPQVCTDEAAGAKLSLDDWFAQRAAAIRKGDTNA